MPDAVSAGSVAISVVSAVHRSRELLPELHLRLGRVLTDLDPSHEIIFVDDACPEGSREVLAELASRDPHVVVVTLDRNVGQHRASLIGLKRARGEWVVLMDADLQDPPEAIPALIARGRQSAGAVFAGRRGAYESRGRLFTSRLFKTALHLLCGVPRDAGMFVAIDRGVVERVLAFEIARPFVVAMIGCSGSPMVSVPVERLERPSGESAYSGLMRLRSALRAFVTVFACRRQVRRARALSKGS